jgi:acyl-CoA thioester hydrolase
VIYADTDAMQIVYHTNYIKWFEVGRNEFMRGNGFRHQDLTEVGLTLPLTKVFCHFLLPARYDDIVLVETTLDYFRRVSIKFNYEIWDEHRENLLVEGSTVHAFTREGKIARPPSTYADKLREIMNQNNLNKV